NGWGFQSLAALTLAFAGDVVRARTLANDLANRFPDHTLVQSYYLPSIRAELALSHDDPSSAIQILQAAVPYELSSEALHPVYVRGEAFLAAHKGNEAAAQFQKIRDHRGIVVNSPIGALAHLGLGRAYVLQGDIPKAKAAYQDFLTLWKDADPDIPILKQAKAEYAKLQQLIANFRSSCVRARQVGVSVLLRSQSGCVSRLSRRRIYCTGEFPRLPAQPLGTWMS